jgi:hypothetical protein
MGTKSTDAASLADAVRSVKSHTKPGPKGFLARLDQAAQDELLELRSQFQAGKFGSLSALEVSRRVNAEAAQRGWPFVSVKEFALWLRR